MIHRSLFAWRLGLVCLAVSLVAAPANADSSYDGMFKMTREF